MWGVLCLGLRTRQTQSTLIHTHTHTHTRDQHHRKWVIQGKVLWNGRRGDPEQVWGIREGILDIPQVSLNSAQEGFFPLRRHVFILEKVDKSKQLAQIHQPSSLSTNCMRSQSLQSLQPHGLYSPSGSSVHRIIPQEYWSGLPFPPLGTFLTQGSKLQLLHWQADSFITEPPWEAPSTEPRFHNYRA